MSTPVVEAALKGVGMQLALLQRKHRFEPLERIEPAVELSLPPPPPPSTSPPPPPPADVSEDAPSWKQQLAEAVGAAAPPAPSADARIAACGARAHELRDAIRALPVASLPNLILLCESEQQRRWLRETIDELEREIVAGDDVVTLLPDAGKKVTLLKSLRYLEGGGGGEAGRPLRLDSVRLTLKGRVACVLTTAADELLLCEAVCTGVLHDLSHAEVAGLLSLFVAKGKLKEAPKLPPKLQQARDALYALAERTTSLQVAAGALELGEGGEAAHVRFALNECMIAPAYHWAMGAPFAELTQHSPLQEGDMVRILCRVEELAKEVRESARILGDAILAKTMSQALDAIKRDVLAAGSLYTDDLSTL